MRLGLLLERKGEFHYELDESRNPASRAWHLEESLPSKEGRSCNRSRASTLLLLRVDSCITKCSQRSWRSRSSARISS